MLKVLAGFGCGVAITALIAKRFPSILFAKPRAGIDHVVIRSRQRTEECKKFYRLFGFEIEREQQAEEFDQTGKGSVIFPIVRINDTTAIDLFGSSTERVWCKKNDKGNVDHICIVMDATAHLETLKRLKSNNHYIVKQFKAWGAQGYGWSTYFNDPTGLYVEIRNYQENRWKEIENYASTMMKS